MNTTKDKVCSRSNLDRLSLEKGYTRGHTDEKNAVRTSKQRARWLPHIFGSSPECSASCSWKPINITTDSWSKLPGSRRRNHSRTALRLHHNLRAGNKKH